jgi:hypothetical protein
MSVFVALTGSDGSLVATDSRRIESDGTVRDDFPKTFRLPKASIIGGYTGLLEFSRRSIPEWLETLPLPSLATLDDVAREAKLLFEAEMSTISNCKVGFQHRRSDIVLVGHDDLGEKRGLVLIRAIVLRPDAASNRVLGEVREFSGFCATGDDAAMKAVLSGIRAMRPAPHALPKKRLAAAARDLIALGVRKAGMSPNFPSVSSCGGPASIVFL